MFIAILDLCTAADDRPTARAQLLAERPAVRAMPGCIDFRVFEAPDDDRRLTVLHEWADRASFDAYTASNEFARSGEVIFPLVAEPPVSRRFEAHLLEVVD
ncbi:putative quinol monooxygenase [Desertimonas flava]|jgi:quinol monooxygenase YgiN|uniref:putative quinol monooxygenase n=1 Tax=Desertimonas flava TaxID=2064846 RepID=UPI000E3483A6|nr:antibiotic biosynthesis monooxygenase [Desertimonas flava]